MTKKEALIQYLEDELKVKRLNNSEVGKYYEKAIDKSNCGFIIKIKGKKVYYYIIDSGNGGRCFLVGKLKDFNEKEASLGFLKEAPDSIFKTRKNFVNKIEQLREI